MKNTIKNFTANDIQDGMEIISNVIVTFVNHWNGQEQEKRAYMNYIVLGSNRCQEESYNYICRNHPNLIQTAEQYVKKHNYNLYHY